MNEFARTLRQARQHLGWSQQQFADRLSIGQQTLSRWESGKSVPRPAMVRAIAAEVAIAPALLLEACGYLDGAGLPLAEAHAITGRFVPLGPADLAVDQPAEKRLETLAAAIADTEALGAEYRRLRLEDMRRLHEKGWTMAQIARHAQVDRSRVKRLLDDAADAAPSGLPG